MDEQLRTKFAEAAISLTKESGYVNAGTIECIVDEDGSFYFLEMNTRLQVEHTVTEMVTGYDLVALQLQVAMGEKLDLVTAPRGAAIQCRINAEDPGRNFLPGPGRITRYEEPGGPFVRVDSGVTVGREIPGDYDSMFAKLIVSGEDRERARRRMLRALSEFHVEGVPTTIPIHEWVLRVQGVPRRHAHHDLAGAGARRRRLPVAGGHATHPERVERGAAGGHPGGGRRAARAGADLRRAPCHGAAGALVVGARTTASTCTARSARPCRGRSSRSWSRRARRSAPARSCASWRR